MSRRARSWLTPEIRTADDAIWRGVDASTMAVYDFCRLLNGRVSLALYAYAVYGVGYVLLEPCLVLGSDPFTYHGTPLNHVALGPRVAGVILDRAAQLIARTRIATPERDTHVYRAVAQPRFAGWLLSPLPTAYTPLQNAMTQTHTAWHRLYPNTSDGAKVVMR